VLSVLSPAPAPVVSQKMPQQPFEQRFFAQYPPATNAQEAATRVYNRGGVLVRSDPHVGPADRKGQAFTLTPWHSGIKEALPAAAPAPVAAPAMPTDPVSAFRAAVLERGGSGGIHTVARLFRIMDDDGNRKLNAEELCTGLHDIGLPMPMEEVVDLISAVSKGKGGTVTFTDFLVAVRGGINARRQGMIDMAYKVLDRTGDGKITAQDIQACFNVDHHPDVLAGRLSPEDALGNFLAQFDTIEQDGTVTQKEFTEYYKNVSASIDNDDYFELMIRNAWHIPGGDGWCENTANTRVLVVHTDGTQKVVMLENDLGLDLNDQAAVIQALKAQGITDIAKATRSGKV